MQKRYYNSNFSKISNDGKKFLEKGYIVKKVENLDSLNFFKKNINQTISSEIGSNINLNLFQKKINKDNLNSVRLKIIKKINSEKYKELNSKQHYFRIASEGIKDIVGTEIAMQNEISLSIQMPKDKSSLLPLHSDTWSGNSPFEVVLWVPLVDCYSTKSMFILENKNINNFEKLYKKNFNKTSDHLFNSVRKYLKFIDIKYGEYMIFNQNLPHGNIVNQTNETRWSMNCRFKGLFSPYVNKKLGEVFTPITISPSSIAGINYKYPKT